MKERPILFNDEMVRAVLEGWKTQTRRVIKPHPPKHSGSLLGPEMYAPTVIDRNGYEQPGPEVFGAYTEDGDFGIKCPFGQPGDRLWVREAFHKCPHCSPDGFVAFRAIGCRDSVYGINNEDDGPLRPKCAAHGWKPSIHMPRLVSRITLEITDVRVERLQDITEEDARAEGISDGGCLECGESEPCGCDHPTPDARDAFIHLWQSIYGRESWVANPWVWVIEFRRVDQ